MKIDIRNIPQEGLEINAEESPNIFGLKGNDITFEKPVVIDLKVSKTGNMLLVNGKLATEVDLVCSRCLDKYVQKLQAKDFRLTISLTGETEVDITEDVRGEIILLLPIKPLCKKNCKGICPKCGKSQNKEQCKCDLGKENIQWQELYKLKF